MLLTGGHILASAGMRIGAHTARKMNLAMAKCRDAGAGRNDSGPRGAVVGVASGGPCS